MSGRVFPSIRLTQPARGRLGPRLHDRRRGGTGVPRCRRRRDRRQRGHGRREIADAVADQAARLAYAHGSAFTTEPLERYAAEVGRHLPVDDPAIYPVSGGSEAHRDGAQAGPATQIARGQADRWIVFARWGSYHGNTLGALDLSGRRPLRRPYEGWLGGSATSVRPTRTAGEIPGSQALATSAELVSELDRAFTAAGPGTVAAFVAEPIVGATLGAVEAAGGLLDGHRRGLPPPRRAADRRRGHDRLRAHGGVVRHGPLRRAAGLLVAAKGATSGTGHSGSLAASGEVLDAVKGAGGGSSTGSRTHTSRWRRRSRARSCGSSRRSRSSRRRPRRGSACAGSSATRSAITGGVGDIRGRGLMVGLELVQDRETRDPFPRAARLVETVLRIARERGLLLYSGTGNADGVNGDIVLLGPPFVVTDDELVRIADGLAEALEQALAQVTARLIDRRRGRLVATGGRPRPGGARSRPARPG